MTLKPTESAQDGAELPKPQSCRQEGLECRVCIHGSAVSLADVCPDLSVESVRNAFFKIYPDAACLPMARTFAVAYRRALPETLDIDRPPDSPQSEDSPPLHLIDAYALRPCGVIAA
jgi:hypothetical protein